MGVPGTEPVVQRHLDPGRHRKTLTVSTKLHHIMIRIMNLYMQRSVNPADSAQLNIFMKRYPQVLCIVQDPEGLRRYTCSRFRVIIRARVIRKGRRLYVLSILFQQRMKILSLYFFYAQLSHSKREFIVSADRLVIFSFRSTDHFFLSRVITQYCLPG